MGPASSALSLGASGLGIAGTLFNSSTQATNARSQGNETGMRDEYRAVELGREATYGEIKAAQVDAFMRDSLQSSLGNILAVRAAAGTSGGPTENAILGRAEAVGDQARTQKVANINEQVQEDRDASLFYQRAGLSAIQTGQRNASNIEISGDLRAGGQALTAASGSNATGSGGVIDSLMRNLGSAFGIGA